jgi:hypothetical protein
LKKDFSTFTKNFGNLSNQEYLNTKGLQKIILLIYLLFTDDTKTGLNVSYSLINFFFKDFFSEIQTNYYPYNFMIDITGFLVSKLDSAIYEEMKTFLKSSDPFWVSSWVMNCLINESKDIFIAYRIMDYLIVSHPLAIYYLCAKVNS